MSNLQFSLGNGIAVKCNGNTVLLDPKVSDFFSFVSHAHADHSPSHVIQKPYCTEETYELIRLRNPDFQANVVKENKAIKINGMSAKLISAGHILGSTQTLIEADGTSILYTGDIKLWQGLTSKAIDIHQADILIVEATYGKPIFKFPLIEDVRKQIVKWILEQNKKGFKVNLGGYHIGKSQEAIKALNQHGIVPQVSDSIRKYCDVYNDFDVGLEFLKRNEGSDVTISPMHVVYSINDKKTKNCVLTGWSLSRSYGMQGFPLSDHCDFEQLMMFIQQVNPKKVFCVHGYSKELAKEIRSRLKIPASALDKREQKSLIDF
ncbi:MAG TPA: MBL fold metallo-hydrolase [archaeon]|nr:MBL fold metallo-hydrolase [archaeon]